MRKKAPSIDYKALAELGEGEIERVKNTDGASLVPGLFARRRGRKIVWLMRYRNRAGVHREVVLGYESEFGVRGRLAQFGVTGDIAAELQEAKGAREPIPAELIGDVASRVRTLIDRGADPVVDRWVAKIQTKRAAAGNRFKDFAEQFLAEGVRKRGKPLRDSTLKEYRRALMVHCAELHDRPAAEITTSDIADLNTKLKTKHGPIAATRTRAALSRFFGWLAGQGKLRFGNPVTGTQTYASLARTRVLTDSEISSLWAWAESTDSDFARIIRLLLWTGARPTEVAGMNTTELDESGAWLLPGERAKNGRSLLLPLPRQARAAIASWRPSGGLLFGRKEGRPFSGWSKAKLELDAALRFDQPWQLRDIRRTVETRLASVRTPQEIINRILNHAVGPITATYNHYAYRDEKAAGLQRWADELDGIVGSPAPSNVMPLSKAG